MPAAEREPTLRLAHINDHREVARLFNDYRIFYEQESDLDLAVAFIHGRISRSESVILLAELHNEAVGFCQLYPTFCSVEAQPIYVLYDLFVSDAARKKGVGRALLLKAEEVARSHGKARMDLTTARTNDAAQRLYESLGWRQERVFLAYSKKIVHGGPHA